MQRALKIGLLFAALSALGCWHKAFHTSIENATGSTIYLQIQMRSNVHAGGILESGNSLGLTQEINDIDFIEYEIDDRRCRIDKVEVVKIARPASHGVKSIALHDCTRIPPEA